MRLRPDPDVTARNRVRRVFDVRASREDGNVPAARMRVLVTQRGRRTLALQSRNVAYVGVSAREPARTIAGIVTRRVGPTQPLFALK